MLMLQLAVLQFLHQGKVQFQQVFIISVLFLKTETQIWTFSHGKNTTPSI